MVFIIYIPAMPQVRGVAARQIPGCRILRLLKYGISVAVWRTAVAFFVCQSDRAFIGLASCSTWVEVCPAGELKMMVERDFCVWSGGWLVSH
jgi:hypothetical protein